MKLAIIDDEKAFAERLRAHVIKLFAEKHTVVDITVTDKSLFIVIGFLVAIICLFFYHFFLTFGVINRRYHIKKWQRIIFSAMLAVLTAPITYFVPYEWIKGFLY